MNDLYGDIINIDEKNKRSFYFLNSSNWELEINYVRIFITIFHLEIF